MISVDLLFVNIFMISVGECSFVPKRYGAVNKQTKGVYV